MIPSYKTGSLSQVSTLKSTTTISTPGATTYTVPSGARFMVVELWGGGGGGGSGRTAASGRNIIGFGGGGGAGGEYCRFTFRGNGNIQAGDVLNLVVGRGGTAGITPNTGRTGSAGGSTTLVSHMRNGITLSNNGITHDTQAYPSSYGLFYSIVSAGGGGGGPASAIPAGGGSFNAPAYDIEQADARVYGANGLNNSGSASIESISRGGTGGAGGSGGAGGTGATFSNGYGSAGTEPGGGGGGGMGSGSASQSGQAVTNGNTGANGRIVIQVYG